VSEGVPGSGPLRIGGIDVAPGERRSLSIPVTLRYTHAEVSLPVHVVRGKADGPRLFLSAAVHGDEINGVEIIRRLLRQRVLRELRGSLLAVPVVNVYGFGSQSRYLPDRRDLNRSFPGSPSGSLASRLANTFMREIVANATHGIDLHTGGAHRANLPQVRACLDDHETERLARAFGAPVVLHASVRDGSLREAARARDIPMLLYEGGEALRFDEVAIRTGVRGILGVMRAIGMLPVRRRRPGGPNPFVARSSSWVRAPEGGVFRTRVRLGMEVTRGERLGVISDPLGDAETTVQANQAGVVIGISQLPLVNEGDALFHVAVFEELSRVARELEAFQTALDPETVPIAPDEEPGGASSGRGR
jgi:predicted deacylase